MEMLTNWPEGHMAKMVEMRFESRQSDSEPFQQLIFAECLLESEHCTKYFFVDKFTYSSQVRKMQENARNVINICSFAGEEIEI